MNRLIQNGGFTPSGTPFRHPALEQVTKPNLTTDEAAYYLNRRPQTLRIWSCLGIGPIKPRKAFGRIDWPTSEVKRIAGVEQ